MLGRGEYSKYSENMKELKTFIPRITPVCFKGAYTRLSAAALALTFSSIRVKCWSNRHISAVAT